MTVSYKFYHPQQKLEFTMNHLRGNAISAGHVQNTLSNSYKILCR